MRTASGHTGSSLKRTATSLSQTQEGRGGGGRERSSTTVEHKPKGGQRVANQNHGGK